MNKGMLIEDIFGNKYRLSIIMKDRVDTYLHQGKRKQLIELLKSKGFKDKAVLNAMERVPRHSFLDSIFLSSAYDDIAFPIGEGQTISHPATVACQTELLNLKKGEKVLEIGTGCGYQTAVLLEMGAKVFTIERQFKLFEKTRVLLPSLGYNARFLYGDGYKGLPAHAPFDKIIVTAGAPSIPEALLLQLRENGGLLIIPVGENNEQVMNRVIRKNGTEFEKTELGKFKFVPLLKNKV
ncbi:MAG TPA: protein-L-isoaspartate(D-aspartate) O-methyltransferase [Nitrosopumilaceae archaeon]|jgi:protein-L-isoaspartate(D-aspartate) O-methyltransferase|nr:protein-L-isoaspartate(D-aspartate) O-methyltransferase [Nitrosopumilaceae archaeon]